MLFTAVILSARRERSRRACRRYGARTENRGKSSALDLAGTKATGANVNGRVRAVDNCLDLTDVGLPGSVGFAVRVRDVVTEGNAFAANAAFCHFDTS